MTFLDPDRSPDHVRAPQHVFELTPARRKLTVARHGDRIGAGGDRQVQPAARRRAGQPFGEVAGNEGVACAYRVDRLRIRPGRLRSGHPALCAKSLEPGPEPLEDRANVHC
jgi:hypothetical protein